MIAVDVYVPAMNKTFDFNLNEDAAIGAVVQELAGMICRKERWPEATEPGKLLLACPALGAVLQADQTLRQSGVKTGYRLTLV